MRRRLTFAIAAAFSFIAAPSLAQLINDGALNTTDWAAPTLLYPPSNKQGGDPSASFYALTRDGNPGAYREIIQYFSGKTATAGANVTAAHLHKTATYSASNSGKYINNITFSYDLGRFSPTSAVGTLCMSFGLVIFQGGKYYRSKTWDLIGVGSADCKPPYSFQWKVFAPRNLSQSDFVQISPSGLGTPDFSCGGGQIQFGFVTSNSTSKAVGKRFENRAGIDNFKLSLTTEPC